MVDAAQYESLDNDTRNIIGVNNWLVYYPGESRSEMIEINVQLLTTKVGADAESVTETFVVFY